MSFQNFFHFDPHRPAFDSGVSMLLKIGLANEKKTAVTVPQKHVATDDIETSKADSVDVAAKVWAQSMNPQQRADERKTLKKMIEKNAGQSDKFTTRKGMPLLCSAFH